LLKKLFWAGGLPLTCVQLYCFVPINNKNHFVISTMLGPYQLPTLLLYQEIRAEEEHEGW
jgi:hypothetical protein